MKKSEINFTNMCDTTIVGMNAGSAIWQNKAPIVTAVNNTKAYRSEISGLSADQASATTASTTEVIKAALITMVTLGMEVVKRLRPFAKATGNKPLLADIDFSESELMQTKQINSINYSKIILTKGREYFSNMEGYELTEEILNALESAINGLSLLSGNRDAIIGSRKTATEGIPVLIDKIRVQLEILDDLIPVLIDDQTFVQTYKNNRRIFDR